MYVCKKENYKSKQDTKFVKYNKVLTVLIEVPNNKAISVVFQKHTLICHKMGCKRYGQSPSERRNWLFL